MLDTMLYRFLGGAPAVVFIRLAFVSLLVGAAMAWLDVDPLGLFYWLERTVSQFWDNGFEALHRLGRYVAGGAAIVVPLWLLTRLFSIGDMRRTPVGRWSLPGSPPTDTEAQGRNSRSA